MTDLEQEPFFKELDGGTMFTAAYAWLHEDETCGGREARNAIGAWGWEDVQTVQTMDERTFPEMGPGPRCAVFAANGFIYLRAEYQTVLNAWRRYRLRYGSKRLTWTSSN